MASSSPRQPSTSPSDAAAKRTGTWRSALLGAVLLTALAQARADAPVPAEESRSDEALASALRDGMALPDLMRAAVRRSPKLREARMAWRAAIEKYPQATALPDPMFMYAYFLRSVETRIGQQNHRVGFTQQFPYPGTLEAGGEVAQAAAQIARARYEAATRDVIVDLKISVHELAYLRRAETITRQNQDILNQILAQTITLYAGGDATLNDLLRAQSQAAQLEYDVLLLEELAAVEIAKIAGILDLPASTVVGPTATVPYLPIEVPIEELEARALAGRQEITIAKLVANKAAEAIDLAVLQTKPMFSFDVMTVQTGGALMPGTRDDGKDPWTIGLGVSLPWSSEKNSSRVREAELQRDAALARKDALARQTATDVHKLYSKLRNAQRLVELYQDTLIPEAAAAMQIAQEWHRDSPKDVSGFLETQTVWLNFNLARVRAIADYQLSLARMERLLGSSVEP